MIIPMLCVTIFVILVVWFLLPRVARLMIHTPTAISIFVCLSMVQLMASAYHLLEGFPFIQEPPSGDLQERVLIRHHDYDQCFQSVQLLQWNSQVKFNVT